MKINTILKLYEGLSAVVYHMTSFNAVTQIAKTDILTGRDGISFTRSITGQYHTYNRLIGVLFEVDGNKLNQRYKGGPVGTEQWKDGMGTDIEYSGRDNKQLEDRVHANEIKNFSKYVRQVYIFVPLEYIAHADKDMFESRYEDQLEHFPEVVAALQAQYGNLKFILSERDLYNKKYVDLGTAKNKIKQVLEQNEYIELSPRVGQYFGVEVKPKYRIYLDVTVECNDEECDSDEEPHDDPRITKSGIRWDHGVAAIEAKDKEDLERILKTISFEEIAQKTRSSQGETGYRASRVLAVRFDNDSITDMDGYSVPDIGIDPKLTQTRYNENTLKR